MNPFKYFSAVQIRIARPTDKLDEIKRFYSEGLGLSVIGSFEKHNDYTGIMYGLPDHDYHLEFIQNENGSPCPAPAKDNLLVIYMPDKSEQEIIADRLFNMSYKSVPPENPYWNEKGITIEDPDGWRIVLMNTAGIRFYNPPV